MNYGNTNAKRKLTVEQVRAMRELSETKQKEIQRLNEEYSAKAFAEKYNVHIRTVEKALSYETWRHV